MKRPAVIVGAGAIWKSQFTAKEHMMRNLATTYLSLSIVAVLALGSADVVRADAAPENLAPKAKVSASSQFSGEYRPQMAINGVIP